MKRESILRPTLGDRRFLLSTGPFDLHPGQAKEIVAAIIVARDSTGAADDYLKSITALRNASDIIQQKYDAGDLFGGALENVTVEHIEPDQEVTVDDLENSGAQLDVTAGEGGVTIEVASFIEPPAGADQIQNSAIHGVGKYIDVLANGDIEWPIDSIKIFFSQNDLDEAGVDIADLKGVYYWRNAGQGDWALYSESNKYGDDPIPPPESPEDTSTTNVVVYDKPQGEYLGYVWARAFHLTLMRIGTKFDSTLLAIPLETNQIVKDYALFQNYPNPFNPQTNIEFAVKEACRVTLKIYDIQGHLISTLVDQDMSIGNYKVNFNADNLASGIYFYSIRMGNYIATKKMILYR